LGSSDLPNQTHSVADGDELPPEIWSIDFEDAYPLRYMELEVAVSMPPGFSECRRLIDIQY
jgi:hypothetical protein